jgi:hypothetical protein
MFDMGQFHTLLNFYFNKWDQVFISLLVTHDTHPRNLAVSEQTWELLFHVTCLEFTALQGGNALSPHVVASSMH